MDNFMFHTESHLSSSFLVGLRYLFILKKTFLFTDHGFFKS